MAEVRRVRAENPGPFTGPGTNTWIVDAETSLVVIDPGPDDEAHLAAIERALAGRPLAAILVTHSHPDHLPLAARLSDRTGARVARHPELRDGDVVRAGRLSLTALHTPGHASDHLAFWMPEDRACFVGDLILGRGSSVIAHPDGSVVDFLSSLDRLEALGPRLLFPGHWDPIEDGVAKIQEYRAHRLERERQVVAALAEGPGTLDELTRRVYGAEVGPELMDAAGRSLRAHLEKLLAEGRVRSARGPAGQVYEPA